MLHTLIHNRAIADVLPRYGHKIMPFVLIGLGAFIVLESGYLNLVNILDSEIFLPSCSREQTKLIGWLWEYQKNKMLSPHYI
jgi:hypothetical protein